ncbi:MAG: ribosomal-processing cysteine protease Prp [Treponema sp.]|nr:ribosomal-processing cysteine protease Prp [Treponema sp.]
MTKIDLICDGYGRIRSCSAKGHASFGHKGKDIVCSAESILFNTVLDLLGRTEGILLKTDTASRGNLAFSVEVKDSGSTERLKCVAEFLQSGLRSLSEQYPAHVQLREKTEDN